MEDNGLPRQIIERNESWLLVRKAERPLMEEKG